MKNIRIYLSESYFTNLKIFKFNYIKRDNITQPPTGMHVITK